MTVKQAQFVRQERILKCPECKSEFNTNELEETIDIISGKYVHTLADCPRCHEIISVDCQDAK